LKFPFRSSWFEIWENNVKQIFFPSIFIPSGVNAKFKRENVLQISWNFECDIKQTIKMNKWNIERGWIWNSISGKFYDVDNFHFRGTCQPTIHGGHTLSLFDPNRVNVIVFSPPSHFFMELINIRQHYRNIISKILFRSR
jgi:hypothetical protein